MVCKNCGTEINDGAEFCTKCGNRIETVLPEDSAIINKSHQLKNAAIIFFIIAALGFLLMTIILWRGVDYSFIRLTFALPLLLSIVFFASILVESLKLTMVGSGVGVIGYISIIILALIEAIKDITPNAGEFIKYALPFLVFYILWVLFYFLLIIRTISNRIPVVVLIITAVLGGLAEIGVLLYSAGESMKGAIMIMPFIISYSVANSLLVLFIDKKRLQKN